LDDDSHQRHSLVTKQSPRRQAQFWESLENKL
jgi:hypothetical protein